MGSVAMEAIAAVVAATAVAPRLRVIVKLVAAEVELEVELEQHQHQLPQRAPAPAVEVRLLTVATLHCDHQRCRWYCECVVHSPITTLNEVTRGHHPLWLLLYTDRGNNSRVA